MWDGGGGKRRICLRVSIVYTGVVYYINILSSLLFSPSSFSSSSLLFSHQLQVPAVALPQILHRDLRLHLADLDGEPSACLPARVEDVDEAKGRADDHLHRT